MQSCSQNLYEYLEISSTATDSQIKKAYRHLAKQYHPDKNKDPETETKFKQITFAYEVRSDYSSLFMRSLYSVYRILQRDVGTIPVRESKHVKAMVAVILLATLDSPTYLVRCLVADLTCATMRTKFVVLILLLTFRPLLKKFTMANSLKLFVLGRLKNPNRVHESAIVEWKWRLSIWAPVVSKCYSSAFAANVPILSRLNIQA